MFMAEPLINFWTLDHFFFGLGVALITSFLLKRKHPISLNSFFILVLWEMFEFREAPKYWLINYKNNIVDVIIGFIAVVIGVRIYELITRSIGKDSHSYSCSSS